MWIGTKRNCLVATFAFLGAPGCSADRATAACVPSDVLLAASDYRSSVLTTLTLDGSARSSWSEQLGDDPVLASSQGRIFWIDRTSGQVIELDPTCGTPIREPWPTTEPDESGSQDPQDLAVDPKTGNVWVARFFSSKLAIKSADGSAFVGNVDLSGVAGVHRNPWMNSIRIIAGANGGSAKAYVSLEMLHPYPKSIDPSYLVRIDVDSRKIEAALQLKARNPFGQMVEHNGALYLASPGDVDIVTEESAGIERVDLATFTSELIVRERDIGASVSQLAVNDACGVAIVMGPTTGDITSNVTSVIGFDPAKGAITTPLADRFLYTDAGFELSGLVWLDGGVNLVGDRTTVPRKGFAIHRVEASGTCGLRVNGDPLYVPQRPVSLVSLE